MYHDLKTLSVSNIKEYIMVVKYATIMSVDLVTDERRCIDRHPLSLSIPDRFYRTSILFAVVDLTLLKSTILTLLLR